MAEIAVTEKTELNRLRQRAKCYFYRQAGRAGLIGSGVALLLALCAPFVLLFVSDAGPVLGAIAGAWIFITRFGLQRFALEWQLKGVRVQEAFDCDVLGIPWNRALAAPMAPEEVHGAASKIKVAEKDDESWYPTEVTSPWPLSVLICQRSNAVWASRQHRSYSYVLIAAMIVWAAFGLIITLAHGATLSDYLVIIILPSLPGVLDGGDLVKRHQWAAQQRDEINEHLEGLIAAGPATEIQIRETQNQLFALRRDGAQVPERFYRHLRDDYERDMRFGAEQMADGAGGGS
jgi:hypothetical protein